jgi:subtilisin-like proprotein convertase family protein
MISANRNLCISGLIVLAASCVGVDEDNESATQSETLGSDVKFHGQPWHDPNELETAAAPAGAHLTYRGGRVVSNIQVVEVVYGSGSFLSQITSAATPNIPSFYQGVLNSAYVDWLTEYNTTTVPTPRSNQTIGRGNFSTRITITPAAARNGATISDANIQAELSAQIAAGTLPAPTHDAAGNTNTYYAIFFPHGKTITQGGSNSCQAGGFCAYHGTISNAGGMGEVYYGVHPDMQAGSGCDTGCGTGTPFANEQSVASHELIETVTDPEVGIATVIGPPLAWYDQTNGEIGDICNAQQGTVVGSDGVTYTVQKEFSNSVNDCIVSKAAVGNDFTISASPGSISVVQGSSGTSTIATAVSSGSAQTVSLSASGVPSGTTASFSPASVTAGGSSTLTLNVGASTAAGTYAITVTGTGASATHTTSVSLTVTPSGGGTCATGTFTSTNVPRSIPDNNATGVSSTLAVTGSGTITGVTLSLHITHTWRGDLSGTLRSPSGTTVTAFARPNANDSADNIVLSNAAIAGLTGQTAAGTWTLTVVDHAAQDVGTIDSWSLNITANCGTPPPPPTCAHGICATGVKLTSGCDPCVTQICAADSFCCNNSWDSICVGEVTSICGRSCP